MRNAKITDTGCYLDNHRGHYITRDAIELAVEFGFIIGQFESWGLWSYAEHYHEEGFPNEALIELCDEAVAWLNSGQTDCDNCDGTGIGPKDGVYFTKVDDEGVKRCRQCSGSGQGDRIEGQNFPPRVPENYHWAFEDGDFGLWLYDDDGLVIG